MVSHGKMMDPSHADGLRDERRKKHLPVDKLVELIAPFAGMTLADIGVGTGYCSLPLLEAVNGDATYYAVDAQQEILDKFAERLAEHPHRTAAQPVLTPVDRIALPDASVDVVVGCSVYHEFPDRMQAAREMRRILKPGGRLVLVDWRPLAPGQERTAGPPPHHRVDLADALAELNAAGFVDIAAHDRFDMLWAVTARQT